MISFVARLSSLVLVLLLAACGDKRDITQLQPFDAGAFVARDAEDRLPDSMTSTGAADGGDAAIEDAEPGLPDAEPAEVGFPDAERAEIGYVDADEPAEAGPMDADVDAGLDMDAALGDAATVYDATVCTGQTGGQDQCSMCAEALCCPELAACAGSFTCTNEFNNCLAPCTLSAPVSQCMAQCFQSVEGVALRTCVTNQCGTVCP